MSTINLPIDDVLKSKLNTLLEEFESCKLNAKAKVDATIEQDVVVNNKTVNDDNNKSSRLNSFLHWFFVTEYETA